MRRKHHHRYQGLFTRLASLARSLTTPASAGLLLALAALLVITPAQGNAQSATYRVTFQGTWTTTVTPGGVPSGAHFTTLIGAVHNDSVTFWSSGGTASAGVEAVAELGTTGAFKSEINANTNAVAVIEKSLPSGGTPTATVDFTVTTAHPLVTLLTMVAPSPDWFVGVSGLSLLDAQGDWLASHSVDLFPYDAGTEEGTGFSLNNAATSPRGTITSIQGTGKFSDEPIASLTFTLQSVAPEITSAATFTVDEGTTAVKTLTAEDQDSAAADLEWSKAGGADADDFTLSAAGELAFAAAPDYENPDDADGDRTYEVTVQVSDGDHTDTADIGVTLQNVIELFTELEGPSSTDYAENGAVRVAAYIASSEADRDGIAWSLGGDDAEHFSIDNPAGVLRFHIDPDDPSLFPQPPDFEAPVDDDGDRVYEVIVLARAGSALTLKSVTVTVTDENEAGAISLDTARPKAAAELMATLTDPDGVTAGTVTWQWERSAGRNTWVVIDGAEAASYTPVAADTNAFLRVTATYDEHGSGHSVQKMATNVVKGPLLMALRVTTDAATANLARAMNPAFEGETLHYAIGCNDSDTMQVTLRAPSGALVAIAGRVPSENSTGEMTTMVEVTPTSDVPISVTDRNGAHTVYHVHCLNAKFYQIEAGRYEDAEGVFEGLLLFRHAGHLVMMDSNGVPRFRETHADARSRTWFFRVGPDGVYRYAYATWISNRVNVLDQHMEVIDEQVSTVFPLRNMDPHDFVILPNGNYLLMSYELKVRDLSHLTFTDENERPYVTHPLTDSAIQIITRDNREALFTWDSWGKMPLGDCVQHRFAKKSESGYAHLNSLQMVGDHTIVGSFRGCSKVLGIDVATGSVKWRVGRTNLSDDEWASRDIGPAPIMVVNDPEGEFCGQHSATLLPNGHLLLFDNGAVCLINPWKRHRKVGTHGEYSRAVEYALDHDAGEAVFVRDHSLHGNKEAFGYSSGQVVPMDNGDWLISWGRNLRGQPLLEETVTQVDPATGQEKFFIRFTAANTEERASLTASPVPADALADTPGPLTAEIVESPASSLFHLGPADAPKVAVAFSRPVVNFAADTTSVSLTGATIAGISPHVVPGDPANAYLFTLTPTGVGPITFALVAGQPCASDGICTADETVLTKVRAPHVISPRTTGPAVASITSSATHPTKDGFTVTITFSEPVTGLTAGEIEVTNGTGSNFGGAEESYTLEIAPDAGIEDEVTVTVTAGAVVDGLNNGSLQASEAFPVDTKVPVVSTIEITSRPQTDATYAPGDAMEVTVTFSETVAVTGMPRLTLNVGGGNRTANYRSGADATLLFSYTVADGESDADGVSIEADSLSRNGGTIQDAADNDAVLDHEALAADSSHKVDGVKPELAVTGGAVVDGATLTLTYDEPLDGTSMPAASAFTVAGGSQSRTVSGVRVSGSTVELTVDPAVEQGETGIRVSYTVPTGMGASLIRDVPGNEALGLSSEAVTNETPDTIAPTVSTVEFSSDPGSDRIYAPEDEIQATVTLSEPVDVERTPRLMLKVGDRDRPAGYLEGTGTTELVFGYEVVDGDEDTDGVSIEANRLSLNADPVLWYAMPAASWNEALPVGNGRLAGMVFGNTGRERIQLNEDTLWAGAPYQRDILGAHRHLPEIRRLLFAGRYVEAQAMVNRELFIGGRVVRAYQTLGDLWIDLGTESQAGYRRELDLETGIARTEWTRDGVAFTREVFASAPHGVLVVRIEADTPGAITGTVELTRPVDATTTAAGTELVLEGRASHGGQQLGVRFQARLRAVPEGGSVVAEGASLRLSGADAVTLILAAATDYRGTAPGPDAVRQVEAAEATGYTALREAHVADHRAIFNRVWLELGGSEWRREPTDTRLRFVRSGGEDTDLEAMYFQFGRYLLMASSRPGTMPANLQGVWNEAVKPPWNSDYHININIQMIYWPADVANLSEMQEPLWDMLDRLRERGRATARDHYGFERGFVAHHTTDAWWWTSPVGSARYGMWPSGGAWLSRHMWEAYLFNRDAAFLRERAYPVLKEAAEFFLDWLVPEPGTDLLLSGPSISPENAFRINGRRTHVTMGPAMDQQIVRDLFENVLAAAAELGIDDAFTQETAAKLTKLAGPQVGTDGRLMEWRQEELVEADPGHRHISHAFGLYPGSQFTVRGTPDLAAAVRKSIEHRVANGGGGTGWSLGWLLNMWARLEAGGKAYSTLRRLLTDMTMDNLLDLHPLLAGTRTNVFQMDGNLGGTAGIAEMLLQSHAGEIHLLPALPRQWSRGVVEGLKARGGFEVSMAWSDGALTTVSIRSRSGEECRVRVAGGEVRTLAVGMGETRWFDGQLSEVRAPQGLGAPRDVAVTGSTPTSLSLSVTWQPPLFEGRSVYGYDVQYAKRGESGFREWPHRGRAPGTTITGLERDAAWKVRVRARNASGPGAWSSAVEYTGDIVAPPPPPVIDTIEITSNPGPDATYAAGDTIEVTVTFDETVAVTRMPQLTLNVGGVDQAANYGSGTGAALVFAYPVADSDLDTDGVSIEANRLSLNGGTIKDGSNNNAVLDHGGLAADSGHKVDAVKPQLAATGGAVVDGTRLTLTYDEALDGGSMPVSGDFTVSGGDRVRAVTGVRVNGSAVELTLDVAAEHGETGITVSYTPGTNPIRDAAGNEAEGLSRVPVTNETPDTTPPEVGSLAIGSNPGSDRTYAAEDDIEVTVTFSETVEVEGTPQLRLRVGTRTRTAGYLRGTDTAALVFGYEVADGDEDSDGVSIEAGRIALNGGTIKDEADNLAELAHGAVAAQARQKVDGVRPSFLSAAVDGASLTLTYGEALDGGSRPASGDFTVEVEGSGRSVSGVSVSGSLVTLTLNPAVDHGDTGTRVSYTVPTGVGTNPIQDEVGNDARGLSNQSVTNTTGAPNTEPEVTTPESFDVPENQLVARRLAARDTDPGDEVTGWSIVGGADQSEFSIASDTGELSFRDPPDFEAPGDNEYVVTVEVRSGAGARELEAEQTFTIRVTDEREPPEVPEAPVISGETADSLEVSWSEPDNTGPAITDYDVQYREKGTGRFIDGDQQGPGRTLTLEDLEPGTVYEVQVRAKNDEGTSDWSASGEGMTVTPLTVVMASGTDPPVSGPFTVRFSFSEPVTGFSASDIETGQDPACVDDQNNTVFCDPGIGTLQTADDRVFTTTVTPWTDRVAHSYTLRLAVPGGAVRSSVGSKPNEEPEEPLEVRVAPPGVTEPISSLGLTASGGNGSVRLSWNRPSDDGGSAIIRYEYRYAAAGEEFGAWENVAAPARSVTAGNLVNGREYVFEVRAVSALGKGGAETVMAVPELRIAPPRPPPAPRPPGNGDGGGLLFPPEAPAGLMALPGEGTVRLEWSPPESDGGTPILRHEYRLKEGLGEFGEWTPIADSAPEEVNATGYTVGELGNGTVYVFELRAVNLVGGGRVSEAVEAVMGLDPAYWSNFGAEDLQGIEASLERGPFGGGPQSLRLRFGAGLRFEESELDGKGEVTETRSGSYGYRYTSRTTGELRLDYDGGKTCELRLTFRGEGAGSYRYRCGGVLGGQGSFRMSGLNRGPEITSAGAYEVAENRAVVGQLEAVDQDKQDEITEYGIVGGADGGLFAVEAGELLFREAPDYETPGDVASDDPQSGAADNEYIVVVEVRSGEGERERKGSRAIRVRVADEEEPPEITARERSRWWRTRRGWGNWRR